MNTNKATLTEKLSDIQIDSRPNADNLNICLCDDYIPIIRFAHEHQDCDPVRLLFQQQRYPDTDMRLVAQQLEGQRQSSAKWPTLAQCADIFYPPKLNREQSSSEATARYKAHIFSHLGGGTFADLTGGMGIDTGDKAIEEFCAVIKTAKTVVWNGPMGCFEFAPLSKGTYGVCDAVATVKANGGTSIIGGGDSVSAVKKSGKAAEMSHISTGGGASLEYLEGKVLPGVAALDEK